MAGKAVLLGLLLLAVAAAHVGATPKSWIIGDSRIFAAVSSGQTKRLTSTFTTFSS
jgi:hypothetical protein